MKEHRLKFPALKNKHYLNYGAQGTLAASALDSIRNSYDYVQEHGPLSGSMFAWIQNEISRTRKNLAAEFGGEPASWAITQNATEGCNIALWGLDWHEGDVLATTDSEHTGVVKAMEQLCKRLKLKLEICPIAGLQSDDQIIAAVEKVLSARPRLFLVSHVLWNTGKVLPLEQIIALCHKHGVKVLADGAQSAGVLPLNMPALKVDFYAITGHKWICGPEGVGGLYVSPESIDTLEPTYVGWRGAVFDATGKAVDWAAGAARYEVATTPFPLLSGLNQAFAVHREFGTAEQRYELILKNSRRLKDQLGAIKNLRFLDEKGGSGLVSFVIEGASHGDLVKQLESSGIILRTIPSPSCIRASVHYFSEEDIDVFAKALEGLQA